MPSSIARSRPFPTSSRISETKGRWCAQKCVKKSGPAAGRANMYPMVALHVVSACCSLFQSACDYRAAESPKCNSAAVVSESKSAVAVEGGPDEESSLQRGAPRGSAHSRSDGMGTVRAAAGSRGESAATTRGDRGRGTLGGVLAGRTDEQETLPDPKP